MKKHRKNNDPSNGCANFEVSRINLKTPPFLRSNPELWFKQIEAQFIKASVKSDSRQFYHVVAAIESEILVQVSDVIISPPTTDMYSTLKNRIIVCFSEFDDARLKKLLKDIKLGDQRPSHLLREMRDLASGKVSDDILKTLWLQRLPNQIKAILTASGHSLNNLAIMADKISEVADTKTDFAFTSSISNNNLSTGDQIIDKLQS